MYEVGLSAEARRFYESAAASLQRKLDRCFEVLKEHPRRHPNIKPLKGRMAGSLRFRVGDYRIIYVINDARHQVIVINIANRREIYD